MSRFNNIFYRQSDYCYHRTIQVIHPSLSLGGGKLTDELHAELCCIQTNAHNASNIYMATIKKLEKLINPYKV